jgi:hypothetical protein
VTCLASSPPAFAHDQSLHKGKATQGEIVSAEPNGLVIKTEDGDKKVTLGEKTKIEVGESRGTREDLKGGARVAVFGTKLPGGEIVAKEIVIQGGAHGNRAGHVDHEARTGAAHE